MEGCPLLKQYVQRKGCKVWADVCCVVCGRVSYGSCAKLSPSVTVCDARDDLLRSPVTIPATTILLLPLLLRNFVTATTILLLPLLLRNFVTTTTILLLPLLLRSLVTRLRRPYLGPIWVAQGSTGCRSRSSKPLSYFQESRRRNICR